MRFPASVVPLLLLHLTLAECGSLTKTTNDCPTTVFVGPGQTCESVAQTCLVTKKRLIELNRGLLNEAVCLGKLPTKVCCDAQPQRVGHTFGTASLVAATIGVPVINTILFRGFSGDCLQQNSRASGLQLMTVRAIGSATVCRTRCVLTLGCNAWNFNKLTMDCEILATFTGSAADDNFVSGPKSCLLLD